MTISLSSMKLSSSSSMKKSTPKLSVMKSSCSMKKSAKKISSTSSIASNDSETQELPTSNDLANNSKFWDIIAPDYDDEILSTIDENTCPSILSVINKYKGSGNYVCADFGCGVGKYLPTLAKRFKSVVGMDFSKGLLNFASQKTKHCKNVGILPALSLTDSKKVKSLLGEKLGEMGIKNSQGLVDFGVCTNVLLSPDTTVQTNILKTLSSCIKKNGNLLLLVPSAESHLWTIWAALQGPGKDEADIFMEFYQSYCTGENRQADEAIKKMRSCVMKMKSSSNKKSSVPKNGSFVPIEEYPVDLEGPQPVSRLDTIMNIVPRGEEGVRTQHFLKEQIIEMCSRVGFKCLNVEKSSYKWNTEIDFENINSNRVGGVGKKVEKKFEQLNSGPWDWVLTLERV